MEELWKNLKADGLYTKSFEDFGKQFSTPESQRSLHDNMASDGLYTRGADEFVKQFFTPTPTAGAEGKKYGWLIRAYRALRDGFKRYK